jgi:hypothetical protein
MRKAHEGVVRPAAKNAEHLGLVTLKSLTCRPLGIKHAPGSEGAK